MRDDYDVLIGFNTHTITPNGWIHEQHNNKAVLNRDANLRAKRAILSREYGLNRYERIENTDFSEADAYLERTEVLWKYVRKEWDRAAILFNPLVLRDAPDQGGLFTKVFELADAIDPDLPRNPREHHADARRAVMSYLEEGTDKLPKGRRKKVRYFAPPKK